MNPAPPPGEPSTATFLEQRATLLAELDASIAREYPEIGAALIRFRSRIDGPELEERRKKLASNPRFFRSPQLNQIVFPAQFPPSGAPVNDYDPNKQWGLDRIHITKAWENATGSKAVRVAVVDSGVALAHPDLMDNLWVNKCEKPEDGIDNPCTGQCGNGFPDDVNGWNFLDRNGNPNDDYGHGSQVAGVIGAVTDNSIGIAGSNWRVSLVALKFYSSQVSGKMADAVEAILYAASLPVDVINTSWKVSGYDEYLLKALEYAQSQRVLVVAAAGRGDSAGTDLDSDRNYPCSYKLDNTLDNLICVTATDADDRRGPLSSWGKRTVDLGAPGEHILSTTVPDDYLLYAYGHSSSMAAPHVSGIAALIRAKCPSWSPLQVREAIRNSVSALPALTETISGGLLDATNAVPTDCGSPPFAPGQPQITQ